MAIGDPVLLHVIDGLVGEAQTQHAFPCQTAKKVRLPCPRRSRYEHRLEGLAEHRRVHVALVGHGPDWDRDSHPAFGVEGAARLQVDVHIL
jgi:hypothetical protein